MDRARARCRAHRSLRAHFRLTRSARRLALAGIPFAFASGALLARLWLRHAPASLARDLAQPLPVVTAWGNFGAGAWAILAGAVLWSALVLAALRPSAPDAPDGTDSALIMLATAASLAACLAWPFVFSSDVYAYAAYGDMALRGLDPYRLVPAAAHDTFIDAARRQWSGPFPVCVYGPAFVGIARLAAAGGASAGVGLTLLALRASAAAAFLASVALLGAALAAVTARRRFLGLCAYGLNPVLIWSAAEGHNDAYVALAACAAAVIFSRGRRLAAVFALALTPAFKASGAVLALAAAVEAALPARMGFARPAIAFFAGSAIALALALPPLLPALRSVGTHGKYEPASLQAYVGLWPALLLAGAASAFALKQLVRSRRDGYAWLGIAVVLALPNVYPWYGLWLAPLTLAAGGGFAAAALWGATISAVLRYLPDAAGDLAGIARLAAALGALPLALALAQFAGPSKKVRFDP